MEKRRLQTRRLTFSAVVCALGVVLLWLGSLMDVLDISMAVLASFINILAVIEIGSFYPWMIWGVTSVLSLLLLPQKSAALLYFLMCGYYPMLKSIFEKMKKPVAWLLKIVFFNIALTGVLWASVKILGMAEDFAGYTILWMYALGNPVFILADICITKLITAYLFKWRKRFRLHLRQDDKK